MLSLQEELTSYANKSTVASVISKWKERSEIYTSTNNFTVCFGFEDCIDSAFIGLKALPTILTVPRQTYENDIRTVETMIKVLFPDIASNSTLHRLLQHSYEIVNRLKILQKHSLHCAEKPEFESESNKDIIVKTGDNVTVRCGDVTSDLPVKYYWKQHDKILDGENHNFLTFKADKERSSVYACCVTSLVGSVCSNGYLSKCVSDS